MSFSYATSSPGSRDKVRLLIGDTASASYVFEDAELDMLLDLHGGDVRLTAAGALRTLAADRAKLAIRYSVNGFSLDRTGVVDRLLTAADKLEASAREVPFELESVLEHSVTTAGEDQSNYPDTEAET